MSHHGKPQANLAVGGTTGCAYETKCIGKLPKGLIL